MSTHHVTLIQFRLRNGQSIGPAALRQMWAVACQTADVAVARKAEKDRFGTQSHIYSLCASPRTSDLAAVEGRMQRLLQEAALEATITLTHAV